MADTFEIEKHSSSPSAMDLLRKDIRASTLFLRFFMERTGEQFLTTACPHPERIKNALWSLPGQAVQQVGATRTLSRFPIRYINTYLLIARVNVSRRGECFAFILFAVLGLSMSCENWSKTITSSSSSSYKLHETYLHSARQH